MGIKRATTSFTYWTSKGVPKDIQAGSLVDWDKASSALKKREHLFVDVETFVEDNAPKRQVRTPLVETTTAEPGVKRSVRPTPSSTDKKEG